jgi:transcriptional regulator with XRE-family HTH domain
MGGEDDRPHPRNYLRAWREHRGLTQAQLAAIVGTEGSVISLLESGDRGLSDKWLRRLAEPLRATPGLLLDFDPEHVDDAMLEIWVRVPEARKADLRNLLDSAPVEDESKGRAGEADNSVVKLPVQSRKQDKNPASKRGRKH